MTYGMYKYLASIRVAAPVDDVFAFYCEPANWRPALPSLLAVEMQGDPPFGVGTRWKQRRRFLWMAQDSAGEVVAFAPPHELEVRIRIPKLDDVGGRLQIGHYMKEEPAGGTQWFVGASLEMPERLPRFVEWTFYAPMRWSARRDLAAFKRAIERRRRAPAPT